MRKLTAICNKSRCSIVFINQLREKVGVMYGNPEVTTGGKALKFYSSVRIDIRKADAIKDGSEVIGNHTKARIVKNKVAPPFKVAEFDILFGKGISQNGCVLDVATDLGIVEKSGSWFSYNDEKIGQGRDKTLDYLNKNPEVFNEINEKVRAKIFENK